MSVSRRTLFSAMGAGAALLAEPLGGRQTAFAAQPAPGAPVIRLDQNENPNGPGQKVRDAIVAKLGVVDRYPAADRAALVEKLAGLYGAKPANVLIGNGSTPLLNGALMGFTSASKPVVVGGITYDQVPFIAKLLGSQVKAVPLDANLQFDLMAMADASRGAGLVYVCNPNNPTAKVHSADDLAAFVQRVNQISPTTMILIDEAYHEYASIPAHRSSMPLAISNPQVMVMRTFSKAYGLAGMRVGYVVADPAAIKTLAQWQMMVGTNTLALAAATSIVGDQAYVSAEQKRNAEARAFTKAFFEKQGLAVPGADANFILVNIDRDSKAFTAACAKRGIIVGRAFQGLETYSRITIGTMPQMQAATEVFATVLKTV